MIYVLIELLFKLFGLFSDDVKTVNNTNTIVFVSSNGNSDVNAEKTESRFSLKKLYAETEII